jgi:hypothetical protein
MKLIMEKSLRVLLKDNIIKILEYCKHQDIKGSMKIFRNN